MELLIHILLAVAAYLLLASVSLAFVLWVGVRLLRGAHRGRQL